MYLLLYVLSIAIPIQNQPLKIIGYHQYILLVCGSFQGSVKKKKKKKKTGGELLSRQLQKHLFIILCYSNQTVFDTGAVKLCIEVDIL